MTAESCEFCPAELPPTYNFSLLFACVLNYFPVVKSDTYSLNMNYYKDDDHC